MHEKIINFQKVENKGIQNLMLEFS